MVNASTSFILPPVRRNEFEQIRPANEKISVVIKKIAIAIAIIAILTLALIGVLYVWLAISLGDIQEVNWRY